MFIYIYIKPSFILIGYFKANRMIKIYWNIPNLEMAGLSRLFMKGCSDLTYGQHSCPERNRR